MFAISIILDAVVIATFILFILFSYKRGFLRSVFGLAGNLTALLGAAFLSQPLAGWIFRVFCRQNILQDIQQKLGDSVASSDFTKKIYDFAGMIPSFVSNSLFQGKSGTDLVNEVLSIENMQNAAENLTDEILAPIITFFIACICFFALYIIIKVLFKLILKLTGWIEHIPVLGQINGLLGAGVGLVNSFIFLALLGTIACFVIFITSDSLTWLNSSIVENTNLFFLFYKLNFLHML